MNWSLNSFLEQVKRIKFRKLLYPVVLLVFISVVAAVFASSAIFLSSSINNTFLVDETVVGSRIVHVNVADIEFVAKKLGITIQPLVAGEVAVPITPVSPTPEAAPPSAPTSTAPAVLNKSELKVSVLNSTGAKGLAATLRDQLVGEGFSSVQAGNFNPVLGETTIRIKDSKSDYKSILQEAVVKFRPVGKIEVLPEDDANDAVVIIGQQ